MWRRPLEWNLNGTTEPRDGSVDHLSPNSLKDRHGPIRAPKSLGVLSSQCLSRRISDKQTLIREVAAWQDHRNKHHAKADWQFTTDHARVKLKRLYPAL